MAKKEWGTKRICRACSARFYDMRKDPIVCPSCGQLFERLPPGRVRRQRATPKETPQTQDTAVPFEATTELVATAPDESIDIAIEEDAEIPDVEDIDDIEDKPDDLVDASIELEDE